MKLVKSLIIVVLTAFIILLLTGCEEIEQPIETEYITDNVTLEYFNCYTDYVGYNTNDEKVVNISTEVQGVRTTSVRPSTSRSTTRSYSSTPKIRSYSSSKNSSSYKSYRPSTKSSTNKSTINLNKNKSTIKNNNTNKTTTKKNYNNKSNIKNNNSSTRYYYNPTTKTYIPIHSRNKDYEVVVKYKGELYYFYDRVSYNKVKYHKIGDKLKAKIKIDHYEEYDEYYVTNLEV